LSAFKLFSNDYFFTEEELVLKAEKYAEFKAEYEANKAKTYDNMHNLLVETLQIIKMGSTITEEVKDALVKYFEIEDDYNDEWSDKRVEYKGRTATVFGGGDGKLDLQFDDAKRTTLLDVPEAEVKIISELNESHDLTTAQIIDRLNPYEFKRGVDYEMAKLKVLDNISYEKVREKVAKKMAKDPLAYRYTQLANAKQIEKDDNRLKMTPVKGENFVDKDNEMKKIKGHAIEKKNTSAPKTENRKGKPKGVKEMKGSKKKPAGVKDVMKSETKETVLNEMINFFKKKDRIKENDGSVSGMAPQ
jgi:hypothetical protein